jgi:hypothetical protein
MARHVKTGIGAPNFIPSEISLHYTDKTSKKTYVSAGTDAISDWKQTSGIGSELSSFLDLTDVLPTDYVGADGKVVRVQGNNLIFDDEAGGDLSDTLLSADGMFNGICLEKQGVTFVVVGGIIYADVINQQNPLTKLPVMIGKVRYELDTLTGTGVGGAARVALLPGNIVTGTAQINFLYVYLDTGVATLGSSATFPIVAKAWIGICSVFDAATTDADGRPFGWQRFNNAVDNGVGDGILNYITEKLRKLGASYQSGILPTVTINTGTTPDSVNFTTTVGTTWQLHLQTFAIQDGTTYYVVNDPDIGIRRLSDLNQITKYADGTTIPNNARFGINTFGNQASDGGGSITLLTLPKGGYNDDNDAINDANNFAVTTVPSGIAVNSTTVRVSRLVFKYTTVGGGGWTNLITAPGGFQDERGFLLGSTGGGGAGGAAPVDSVNGKTGVVILDPDDLDDSATVNKFILQAELDAIGVNTAKISYTDAAAVSSNTTHRGLTTNPHSVTKAQVGLGSADNTSDADKPISTDTQNALDGKEPSITSGTTSQFWRGDKTFQEIKLPSLHVLTPTSGAVTLDWDAATVFRHDLTGNTTFTSTNQSGGKAISISIKAAGTGTPTFTSVSFPSGNTPDELTSGQRGVVTIIDDGTAMLGVWQRDF